MRACACGVCTCAQSPTAWPGKWARGVCACAVWVNLKARMLRIIGAPACLVHTSTTWHAHLCMRMHACMCVCLRTTSLTCSLSLHGQQCYCMCVCVCPRTMSLTCSLSLRGQQCYCMPWPRALGYRCRHALQACSVGFSHRGFLVGCCCAVVLGHCCYFAWAFCALAQRGMGLLLCFCAVALLLHLAHF